MNFLRKNLIFWIIALCGLGLDIGSKSVVFNSFGAVVSPKGTTMAAPYQPLYQPHADYPNVWVPEPYRPLSVIPNLFAIRIAFNLGAVWSSFHGQTMMLTVVSLVAILFVLYLLYKHACHWHYQIMLGLILAGALGNLWDRIWYGGVRDFLDVYWQVHHWPTFNLADCYIVIGIGCYIVLEWRKPTPVK